MPPLIRSTRRSMNPPISIAPQKVISPSPWREVQVAHGEVCAVDEHRVEDPGALGEVLDVLVAAVLPRRCGAGRLVSRRPCRSRCRSAYPRIASGCGGSASGGTLSGSCRSGRPRACSTSRAAGDGAVPMRPGWTIPVNDTHGTCRDVAWPPGEVPDHLVGVGELLGQEAAAVLGGEDAGVAPALPGERAGVLLRDRADVEDVDDQQVAGLRRPRPRWDR